MDYGWIAAIVASIGTLALGVYQTWTAYNQRTKNKLTDFKIKKLEKETSESTARNTRNTVIIYGEMWKLLHDIDADRCFILQPHPPDRNRYISVLFEVDKSGITLAKEDLQNIPIAEVADFVNEIMDSCWLEYSPGHDVKNGKIRSLRKMRGTNYSRLKQLVNTEGNWVGTLVAENNTRDFSADVKEKMKTTANTIQYILPQINQL
jgi:hypothetical protein